MSTNMGAREYEMSGSLAGIGGFDRVVEWRDPAPSLCRFGATSNVRGDRFVLPGVIEMLANASTIELADTDVTFRLPLVGCAASNRSGTRSEFIVPQLPRRSPGRPRLGQASRTWYPSTRSLAFTYGSWVLKVDTLFRFCARATLTVKPPT